MHNSAFASIRRLLAVTAAAVFFTLASMPLLAQDDDPPAQAGRLSSISGTVSIQQLGDDDWSQAQPNLPFAPGDRIYTDTDGRAEIQVGQTFIRLGPNSDVSFNNYTPNSLSIGVAQGSVRVHCEGLWRGQELHLNSPSGSGGLFDFGDLRVDVILDEHVAVFTSYSNVAHISATGGYWQDVSSGQALELAGSNPVSPQWLEPADPDDLDQWSRHRDKELTNVASYRYVSPEMPGAHELDANGTWQPGTEYGAVWFPNNVPADWEPYHYGHWVNRAPWGWVWVADESWGYAPFHYGRWVNYSGRWGWVPGPPAARPVWSPALVVFAGGDHDSDRGAGVSAWFPLGPGEPYRPWYHASPRYIDDVNISNIGESRRVHVQNTYVNVNVVNITYVNRSIGVSAMHRDDFAAGRSAHKDAVVVDRRQFDHVRVLDRPDAQPDRRRSADRPPARPVPVQIARPVLIDEKGKLVSAKPGVQPVDPPVKPVPPVRPLPGRIVVAPPPGSNDPANLHGGHRNPPGVPASGAPPAATPGTAPGSVPTPRQDGRPGDRGTRFSPPVQPPTAPPTGRPTPPQVAPPIVPPPTVSTPRQDGRPGDRGTRFPPPVQPPTAPPTGRPAPPQVAPPIVPPPLKPAPPLTTRPPALPPAKQVVPPPPPPRVPPVTRPPALQPARPVVPPPNPPPAVKPMLPPPVRTPPPPPPTAPPVTKPPALPPARALPPPAVRPTVKPDAPPTAKPQQEKQNDPKQHNKDRNKDEKTTQN